LESEDDTIESGVEESSNEAHMRRKIHGSKAVSTDFDQNSVVCSLECTNMCYWKLKLNA